MQISRREYCTRWWIHGSITSRSPFARDRSGSLTRALSLSLSVARAPIAPHRRRDGLSPGLPRARRPSVAYDRTFANIQDARRACVIAISSTTHL